MASTRRIISAGITVLLMIPVHALGFFDVPDTPYEDAIQSLFNRGIVEGYSDGTFRPEAAINRAEFLKILMDARFPGRAPTDLQCFKDLEVKVPQWYARTTCAASELGIVNGYPDRTFRPDRNVNLVEALKMALLSFRISVDSAGSGPWYEPYLNAARNHEILTSLLKTPGHTLTRGEMASIIDALLQNADVSDITTVGTCGNGVIEGQEQCDDGNTEDSDGCSSICISVPEPVRIAFLQIDQQTTGSLQMVARGQKGVTLLRFTATAGRQDAILTSLTFQPSVGSLLYAQHYTLAMDRDGDGVYNKIVQGEGRVTADRLIFDDIFGGGVPIPENVAVPFEIRADLASTLGPVSLGLQFATGDPGYVEAQGVVDGIELEGIETDGVCTGGGCFIRVNTVGSHDINVQSRGNLYITEDSKSVRSHILLAGSTTDELLRLRLHSDSEPVDIRTIRIDGVPSNVDALLLYQLSPGGSVSGEPVAQASHGQCPQESSTRFCANLSLRSIVVSPTSDVVLAIVAQLKNDQLGAVSGQLATLSITSSTSSPAFSAQGVQSQEELSQNDGNTLAGGEVFVGIPSPGANTQILGKTNDIAFASISSVSREGPDSDRPVPTGMQPIGAFRIAAYPHTNSFQGSNAVVFNSFAFHVNAQNVQMDPASFRLSLQADPSTYVECSAPAGTGSFDVTCSGLHGAIQDRLEQGQFAVYRLSANVTNPQIAATTSVLQVSLPVLGQRGATNSISWSDESTSFTWVDIPETIVDGTAYRN